MVQNAAILPKNSSPVQNQVQRT